MVSVEKAKQYVHANGTMWERAVWDYLFDDGSVERVHQTIACYKNTDHGFGHGLEHDVKCPDSTVIALEFGLTVFRETHIPVSNLFEGSGQWVIDHANEDGTLRNPSTMLDYPCAPWQRDGHDCSLSTVGNLFRFGYGNDELLSIGHRIAKERVTLEKIAENDWFFMCYRPFDFYFNIPAFDDIEDYQEAVLANMNACLKLHIEKGEMKKLFPLFQFIHSPNSPLLEAIDQSLVEQTLDYYASTQREDGGWDDEHGLKYWQPYFSTLVLLGLKRFNRI